LQGSGSLVLNCGFTNNRALYTSGGSVQIQSGDWSRLPAHTPAIPAEPLTFVRHPRVPKSWIWFWPAAVPLSTAGELPAAKRLLPASRMLSSPTAARSLAAGFTLTEPPPARSSDAGSITTEPRARWSRRMAGAPISPTLPLAG
jgi:hypothetical protein